MAGEERTLVSNSYKHTVRARGRAAFHSSFISALASLFPATDWLSPHGEEHGHSQPHIRVLLTL